MEAILAGVFELVQLAIKMGVDAAQAAKEQHQAILDRLTAARASLAGDKTDAHAAVEADLLATQTKLDEIKAQHAAALKALAGQ